MNNRETATFILLGALTIWVLFRRDTRTSLGRIGRQLLWSSLTPLLVGYFAVICGATYFAARLNLWTPSLIGATTLWFLVTGFAWFINLGDAGKDPDFFKRRFLETLRLAAVFEFFINAQPLPLLAEISGQLFLIFLVALNTFAGGHEEYRAVSRLTGGTLVMLSLALLAVTFFSLVNDWEIVDKASLRNELLMPIWLSASVIPYLYLVAFYMGYQVLFIRLSFMNSQHPPGLRAKLGMIFGLRGSLVDIGTFRGPVAREAAQASTLRGAFAHVRSFKELRAAVEVKRAGARRTMTLNAGRSGLNDDGLVLDRREFAQTKEALRWLATCHMGWYQRDDRPNEYRGDLLDMLVSTDAKQFAFESPEPVIAKTRKDGQAWFAYRMTPSGHFFGIGADGPPASQWFYDGPSPPDGYPSIEGRGWTHFMSPDRPEWRTEPEP